LYRRRTPYADVGEGEYKNRRSLYHSCLYALNTTSSVLPASYCARVGRKGNHSNSFTRTHACKMRFAWKCQALKRHALKEMDDMHAYLVPCRKSGAITVVICRQHVAVKSCYRLNQSTRTAEQASRPTLSRKEPYKHITA
jgi:hypothetical protein